MVDQPVVEPWEIVSALLTHDAATIPMLHEIIASAAPLDTGPMACGTPQPIEAVFDVLFDGDGAATPRNVYALLDAHRSMFLPTRLESSGLEYSCLYDLYNLDGKTENLGETAPWLVALERDNAFSRATLARDPVKDDPRKMLGHGIWLVSALPLDELRRHLKHYTKLNDEAGVPSYFRLQEPGMLDALLTASGSDVQAGFFSGVARVVYPRPALKRGIWDFVSLRGAQMNTARKIIPLLDRPARKALTIFVNDRRARLLAVEAVDDPSERPFASWVFSRMMNATYDHPPRLIEAFHLLKALPPEARTSFWATAESGKYSPRGILLDYAERYNIKGIFEDTAQ